MSCKCSKRKICVSNKKSSKKRKKRPRLPLTRLKFKKKRGLKLSKHLRKLFKKMLTQIRSRSYRLILRKKKERLKRQLPMQRRRGKKL